MLLIGTIPAVWLVTSPAVLLPLPARWGGRWMAGRGTHSFQGLLLCVAALFVAWTAAFLAAVLFFIPVSSALMLGFRRAQATQKLSIDGAVG